jgi:c-di-GMP-related signal transduction protein
VKSLGPDVNTPHLNSDSREGLYVARQPILNPAGQVFGYELLYRTTSDESTPSEAQELAAARVLSDAVLALGLETLTGGRRAFMNMSRAHLLSNVATLLPAKAVVLEVLEKVEIDNELIAACKSLRSRGYSLALEDFTLDSPQEALLPHVNFIKVDTRSTTPAGRQAIKQRVPSTMSLVAEHVETAEIYEDAKAGGFHLFQGFYFCKPTMFKAGALPARRMAYAQLLTSLNDPNVTVSRIEDLIKHDASLSYRVLRCVNSAAYGIQRQVQSIRQAVVLLGLDQIRKWASVWALAGLNEGSSSELVSVAILRARSCELIAQTLMTREEASEYFLLGMCSLLDVILQKPLDEALADLPLSDTVHKALLGEENLARVVLDAVIAYERGQWDESTRLAQMAGVPPTQLPAAYADALKWARELTQAARAA